MDIAAENSATREAFHLRPANQGDAPAIKSLVQSEHLNPMGLEWQRFLVAQTLQGEFIGCGQVKTHGDGSRELASIAVMPAWRGRGVASALIRRLIAEHGGALYLTCRQELEAFYQRFGFEIVAEPKAMPGYFRAVSRIMRLLHRLKLVPSRLLVMRREAKEAG